MVVSHTKYEAKNRTDEQQRAARRIERLGKGQLLHCNTKKGLEVKEFKRSGSSLAAYVIPDIHKEEEEPIQDRRVAGRRHHALRERWLVASADKPALCNIPAVDIPAIFTTVVSNSLNAFRFTAYRCCSKAPTPQVTNS